MDLSDKIKVLVEERKRQLAELREEKKRREEKHLRNITEIGRNLSEIELIEDGAVITTRNTLQKGFGIASHFQTQQTNSSSNVERLNNVGIQCTAVSRIQNLSTAETRTISVSPKVLVKYSKVVQTDENPGKQEIDNEMAILDQDNDRRSEEAAKVMDSMIRNYDFNYQKLKKEDFFMKKDQKIPALSEEEKLRILNNQELQKFVAYSATFIERVLAEEDAFVDHNCPKIESEVNEPMKLSRIFFDEDWSANRPVICMYIFTDSPELIAVSYGEEAYNKPAGVVLIWNTRFEKKSPDFILYCNSKVTNVIFEKFHPNLIFGGCYSGQICMWDNRVKKRTPVNKSSLGPCAHWQPVFGMKIVGDSNVNKLLSFSVDGRLCSWNILNLDTPIEVTELLWNNIQVTCTCLSFAYESTDKFIFSSQEGYIYAANSNAIKENVSGFFEGHFGPIMSVDTIKGSSNLSHLFLSCCTDGTVKLWTTRERKLLYSFEKHNAYVADIACCPTNPAAFASADVRGNLFLWNLNDDFDVPIAKIQLDRGVAIRKIMWTQNGKNLVVGDENGKMWLYEVQKNIANCESKDIIEFTKKISKLFDRSYFA